MSAFLVAMVAGFAGSFHCVGMCGGFACGLAQSRSGSRFDVLLHSLLYNLGRLTTYAFIGALAGAFGAVLISADPSVAHAQHNGMNPIGMILAGEIGLAQRALSIVAGLLMLRMALDLLGVRHHIPTSWARLGGETVARIFRTLLISKRPSAAIALGVANGFLPCPLVLAFAAAAAATGTVTSAVLIMIAFGLGTFPAMLFMGAVGVLMTPAVRIWGVRLSGAFVFIIGLVTLARGIIPGLLHGMHLA